MLKVVLRICDNVLGGEPLFVSIHNHMTCISTLELEIHQALHRVFFEAMVTLSWTALERWFG